MGEYSNRICTCESNMETNVQNEVKKVVITVGVFFDGTCNNKYNSTFNPHDRHSRGCYILRNGRKVRIGDDKDDSYEGDLTNIAKLWGTYLTSKEKRIGRVYIEGPGTEAPVEDKNNECRDAENLVSSNKSDDGLNGSGHGCGSTGIFYKLERACKLIADKVSILSKGKEAKRGIVLYLDIFGFSRGAAEARLFVNMMHVPASKRTEHRDVDLYSHLNKALDTKVKVRVRFMGLFDTVLSYDGESFLWPQFEAYEDGYDLKIYGEPQRVIHIVAADEYRKYFSLTTVKSAIDGLAGTEIILPGAHSDIGGGYAEVVVEDMRDGNITLRANKKYRGFKYMGELLEQGWAVTPPQLVIKGDGRVETHWDYNRYILNYYSKIPLRVMSYFMRDEHILLKTEVTFRSCNINDAYKNLKQLEEGIMSNVRKKKRGLYIIKKNDFDFCGTETERLLIKSVRYNFMHLSAHIASWGVHNADKNNKRRIREG